MYQIPELLKFSKLFHAFSTRKEGNLDFRFGDSQEVTSSRKKFLSKLDINLNECVVLNVQHSDRIVRVDSNLIGCGTLRLGDAIKADCLITDYKKVFLFLLIADCLPIIIYDSMKEAIALVHAGWKGTDLEIVKKVIRKLRDLYKSNAKDLVVGIGPTARKDSFIKENPSQKDDPKWKPFMEKVGDRQFKVDFIGLAKKQLVDSGVRSDNIYDCYIDTVRDNRFFSHVREGKLALNEQGRFACVVGLI